MMNDAVCPSRAWALREESELAIPGMQATTLGWAVPLVHDVAMEDGII